MNDSDKTGELGIKPPAQEGLDAALSNADASAAGGAAAGAAGADASVVSVANSNTENVADKPAPSQHEKDKAAAIDALFADAPENVVSFIAPDGSIEHPSDTTSNDVSGSSADESAADERSAQEGAEQQSAAAADAADSESDEFAQAVPAEATDEDSPAQEPTTSSRPSVKKKAKTKKKSLKEKLLANATQAGSVAEEAAEEAEEAADEAKTADEKNVLAGVKQRVSSKAKGITWSPAKIVLLVLAMLLLIFVVLATWFSVERWGHDDAADFQGTWYADNTDNVITIDGETLQLNSEIAYNYTLDTNAKTITFSFGRDYSGEGRYRFSPDRTELVITDGTGYDWWSTLGEDISWRWDLLIRQITGNADEETPYGNGVTVLSKTSASEKAAAAEAKAAAEAAAAAGQAGSQEAASTDTAADAESAGEATASADTGEIAVDSAETEAAPEVADAATIDPTAAPTTDPATE